MKLKLDEHLPLSLARSLRVIGHDAVTVVEQGWSGHSDHAIRPRLCQERRTLLTQDVAFADVRRALAPGSPGIILLRLPDMPLDVIRERVLAVFAEHEVEAWIGCCVTVTSRGVRVRTSPVT